MIMLPWISTRHNVANVSYLALQHAVMAGPYVMPRFDSHAEGPPGECSAATLCSLSIVTASLCSLLMMTSFA